MHYDNIYIRVASNIKKYRKEKGMTQEKLAEQTGYSFVNIRRIEAPNYIYHIKSFRYSNI